MKTRYWVAIAIAGILIGMSAYYYATRLGAGDRAPDFTLPDRKSASHALGEYRGDVVVLHFWATWCDICRYEMPALDRMSRAFEGKGLTVVSILEDDERAAEQLAAFMQAVPISFTVLLDERGDVARAYDSFAVPETFFIDRDGMILKRISGAVNWEQQREYLEQLITH